MNANVDNGLERSAAVEAKAVFLAACGLGPIVPAFSVVGKNAPRRYDPETPVSGGRARGTRPVTALGSSS